MDEVIESIAAELLCPLSNTLPIAPVLCEDGRVYEKDAVEHLRNKSNLPLISKSPVHSKLRNIIERLVSTGKVRDEYLGSWAARNQAMGGASNGDSRSMVELGEMYLKGNAGGDAATAFELFERASELEDEIGTARKADCLLTGTGVEKDFDEGYQLLVEAAQMDESGERDFRRILLIDVFYNIITNITLSARFIETHVLLQRWHSWLSTIIFKRGKMVQPHERAIARVKRHQTR